MKEYFRRINPIEKYRKKSEQKERLQTHASLVNLFTRGEIVVTRLVPSYRDTAGFIQDRPVWITETLNVLSDKGAVMEYFSTTAGKLTAHYDPDTAREIQIKALGDAHAMWSEAYELSDKRADKMFTWNGKKITNILLQRLQNPPLEQV